MRKRSMNGTEVLLGFSIFWGSTETGLLRRRFALWKNKLLLFYQLDLIIICINYCFIYEQTILNWGGYSGDVHRSPNRSQEAVRRGESWWGRRRPTDIQVAIGGAAAASAPSLGRPISPIKPCWGRGHERCDRPFPRADQEERCGASAGRPQKTRSQHYRRRKASALEALHLANPPSLDTGGQEDSLQQGRRQPDCAPRGDCGWRPESCFMVHLKQYIKCARQLWEHPYPRGHPAGTEILLLALPPLPIPRLPGCPHLRHL